MVSKKQTSPPGTILLGTAGWTVPRANVDAFPAEGSHLERYGRVLHAVEINSTFHRPHRAATYERWAGSVPDEFRFCLKAPKTITHTARLVNSEPLLDAFLKDAEPLGRKLGCVLFQLPPSFAFDTAVARSFFSALRERYGGDVACEPRHASWLESDADRLLANFRIARVAADPAKAPGAEMPGGWTGLRYFRWHGSPRMYYSSYEDDALARLARRLREESARGAVVWCMFDNTVTGAAMANALAVRAMLDANAGTRASRR
jgi:uncharacterized protein YecE (DUF72 family)